MTDIDSTLEERGTKYGTFMEHARIAQAVKAAMVDSPNWESLDYDMREALDMMAQKVGRILNGDFTYIDSWHDIIGYIRLVEQRLEKEQKEKDAANTPDPNVFINCRFDTNNSNIEGPLVVKRWTSDPRDTVVERGVPDVQEDLFPSTLVPTFRGYDGVYEYWEYPDGRVEGYNRQSNTGVQESTVSGLFRERGSTFDSLYDLTKGNSSGAIPLAARNRNGR